VAADSHEGLFEALAAARAKPSAPEEPNLRAVILAGGRGTRLAPYTSVLPKPLMPVGDRSILEIVLEQLSNAGVKDVTLAVGYLSHLIRAVLHDHSSNALRIEYVYEEKPLGTAGPLKLVRGLDSTFLVMNGDVLTTLDYPDLVRRHRESGSVMTIATHARKVKIDYGIVRTDEDNRLIGFDEKPEISAAVSMGVYVMEPEVLDFIPGGHMDFPDLVEAVMAAGGLVMTYPYDGLWFDIGRHDDFQLAVTAWAESLNGKEHGGSPDVMNLVSDSG
jgi:NDP-mannose synthase